MTKYNDIEYSNFDNSMYIKKISYEYGKYKGIPNAFKVIVTDGILEVLCFGYDSKKHKKNDVVDMIDVLETDLKQITDNRSFEVIKLEPHFSYRLRGKVIDSTRGIITVGRLLFDVGKLPINTNNGDYIEFIATRLDVFQN